MTAKQTRKQKQRRRRRAVFLLLLLAVLGGVGFFCLSVFCRVGNITVTAVAAALGVLFVFRQRMKLDAHSLSKLCHSITYLIIVPCRARIEYAVIH